MSFTLRPLLAAFAAAGASTCASVALFLFLAVYDGGAMLVAPIVLPAAFVVTLFHAVVLGLPLYAVVPRGWRESARATLGASFLVGALPITLLLFLFSGGMDNASGNGVATAVNGHPTIYFYLEFLATVAVLGSLGMIGGFIFWVVVNAPGSQPDN